MVKILVIGDLHGNLGKVKKIPIEKVDLILLTGDLGKSDLARKFAFGNRKRISKGLKEKEYSAKASQKAHMEIHNSTLSLLKYLSKFAPVYTIQGNVGISTKAESIQNVKKYKLKHPSTKEEIDKLDKVFLIKNRLRILNNLRIGFLEYFIDNSWIREFKEKDKKRIKLAKKETAKAKRVLSRFKNLDILICHQPPYGILDKVSSKWGAPKDWWGKYAGSKVILNYIKKQEPKYVFCGHIHEGEGKAKIGNTKIFNLGVAGYKIINLHASPKISR